MSLEEKINNVLSKCYEIFREEFNHKHNVAPIIIALNAEDENIQYRTFLDVDDLAPVFFQIIEDEKRKSTTKSFEKMIEEKEGIEFVLAVTKQMLSVFQMLLKEASKEYNVVVACAEKGKETDYIAIRHDMDDEILPKALRKLAEKIENEEKLH